MRIRHVVHVREIGEGTLDERRGSVDFTSGQRDTGVGERREDRLTTLRAGRLMAVDGADDLEKAYREEATRIRAALAARLGDVGLAEEIVQDTFIEALEHWRAGGVPPSPGGWLAHAGLQIQLRT